MVEKQRQVLRCVPVIVAQQPTETIATDDHPALVASFWLWSNQLVAEALIIPLRMIVRELLLDHIGQRPLA
jgi:hypothetical protein